MKKKTKIARVVGTGVLSFGLLVGGIYFGQPVKNDSDSSSASAGVIPARYYNYGEIPEYPGSIEYPIGNALSVNNVNIKMSYFYTMDNVDSVKTFYVNKLKGRGLMPRVNTINRGEVNIYSLSEDGENQISISAVRLANGRTLVLPAIIPVSNELFHGKILPTTNNNKYEIPFSEDAIGLMNIKSQDDRTSSVSYFEPKFDFLTGIGYIRDSLGRRSWNIENQTVDYYKKSAIIEFNKGGGGMTVAIAQGENMNGVSVVVNVNQAATDYKE